MREKDRERAMFCYENQELTIYVGANTIIIKITQRETEYY